MIILPFGADCEVLAPDELLREVRMEIGKMAGLYEGVTGDPAQT